MLNNEEEPPLPAVRPVPTPVTLDYGLEDLQIPPSGGPDTHPYFVGTQAHPELRSRPTRPHPLFSGLVAAAVQHAEGLGDWPREHEDDAEAELHDVQKALHA